MSVQFRIVAEAEAQCLPRLIAHFAQRGLIPSAVSANHIENRLEVIIEHPTIDDLSAALIRERLEQSVAVASAVVTHRPD
ncbi:hypothetical protein [Sphingomonas oryzagri]